MAHAFPKVPTPLPYSHEMDLVFSNGSNKLMLTNQCLTIHTIV
jgi:hypothetical protein